MRGINDPHSVCDGNVARPDDGDGGDDVHCQSNNALAGSSNRLASRVHTLFSAAATALPGPKDKPVIMIRLFLRGTPRHALVSHSSGSGGGGCLSSKYTCLLIVASEY